MLRTFLLSVTALVCVAAAHAQETNRPPPPPADARVYEMDTFCAANPSRFFPDRAVRRRVSGEVIVDCTLSEDNTAERCQIVNETPRAYGFGRAGLTILCHAPAGSLANTGATNTVYTDDVGQRRVRRTVRFQFGDTAAPSRESGDNTNQ